MRSPLKSNNLTKNWVQKKTIFNNQTGIQYVMQRQDNQLINLIPLDGYSANVFDQRLNYNSQNIIKFYDIMKDEQQFKFDYPFPSKCTTIKKMFPNRFLESYMLMQKVYFSKDFYLCMESFETDFINYLRQKQQRKQTLSENKLWKFMEDLFNALQFTQLFNNTAAASVIKTPAVVFNKKGTAKILFFNDVFKREKSKQRIRSPNAFQINDSQPKQSIRNILNMTLDLAELTLEKSFSIETIYNRCKNLKIHYSQKLIDFIIKTSRLSKINNQILHQILTNIKARNIKLEISIARSPNTTFQTYKRSPMQQGKNMNPSPASFMHRSQMLVSSPLKNSAFNVSRSFSQQSIILNSRSSKQIQRVQINLHSNLSKLSKSPTPNYTVPNLLNQIWKKDYTSIKRSLKKQIEDNQLIVDKMKEINNDGMKGQIGFQKKPNHLLNNKVPINQIITPKSSYGPGQFRKFYHKEDLLDLQRPVSQPLNARQLNKKISKLDAKIIQNKKTIDKQKVKKQQAKVKPAIQTYFTPQYLKKVMESPKNIMFGKYLYNDYSTKIARVSPQNKQYFTNLQHRSFKHYHQNLIGNTYFDNLQCPLRLKDDQRMQKMKQGQDELKNCVLKKKEITAPVINVTRSTPPNFYKKLYKRYIDKKFQASPKTRQQPYTFKPIKSPKNVATDTKYSNYQINYFNRLNQGLIKNMQANNQEKIGKIQTQLTGISDYRKRQKPKEHYQINPQYDSSEQYINKNYKLTHKKVKSGIPIHMKKEIIEEASPLRTNRVNIFGYRLLMDKQYSKKYTINLLENQFYGKVNGYSRAFQLRMDGYEGRLPIAIEKKNHFLIGSCFQIPKTYFANLLKSHPKQEYQLVKVSKIGEIVENQQQINAIMFTAPDFENSDLNQYKIDLEYLQKCLKIYKNAGYLENFLDNSFVDIQTTLRQYLAKGIQKPLLSLSDDSQWITMFNYDTLDITESVLVKNLYYGLVKGYQRVFELVDVNYIKKQVSKQQYNTICVAGKNQKFNLIGQCYLMHISQFKDFAKQNAQCRFEEVLIQNLEKNNQEEYALMCTSYSDEEYKRERCNNSEKIYHQEVGQYYQGRLYQTNMLPIPSYLQKCIKAYKLIEFLDNFLDNSFLGNRGVSIRQYLKYLPENYINIKSLDEQEQQIELKVHAVNKPERISSQNLSNHNVAESQENMQKAQKITTQVTTVQAEEEQTLKSDFYITKRQKDGITEDQRANQPQEQHRETNDVGAQGLTQVLTIDVRGIEDTSSSNSQVVNEHDEVSNRDPSLKQKSDHEEETQQIKIKRNTEVEKENPAKHDEDQQHQVALSEQLQEQQRLQENITQHTEDNKQDEVLGGDSGEFYSVDENIEKENEVQTGEEYKEKFLFLIQQDLLLRENSLEKEDEDKQAVEADQEDGEKHKNDDQPKQQQQAEEQEEQEMDKEFNIAELEESEVKEINDKVVIYDQDHDIDDDGQKNLEAMIENLYQEEGDQIELVNSEIYTSDANTEIKTLKFSTVESKNLTESQQQWSEELPYNQESMLGGIISRIIVQTDNFQDTINKQVDDILRKSNIGIEIGTFTNDNAVTHETSDYKNLDLMQNSWVQVEGQLKNGSKTGSCNIQFQNGDSFTCEFVNDKANGFGIYKMKNGDRIIGQWINNKLQEEESKEEEKVQAKTNEDKKTYVSEDHNFGLFVNTNCEENPDFDYRDLDTLENHWKKIKGSIVKGKKTGKCQIYLFNGDIILCNFTDNKANGKGSYKTKRTKQQRKVEYKDNKLIYDELSENFLKDIKTAQPMKKKLIQLYDVTDLEAEAKDKVQQMGDIPLHRRSQELLLKQSAKFSYESPKNQNQKIDLSLSTHKPTSFLQHTPEDQARKQQSLKIRQYSERQKERSLKTTEKEMAEITLQQRLTGEKMSKQSQEYIQEWESGKGSNLSGSISLMSKVSQQSKYKKGTFRNPNPVENPDFDYRDLSTLKNHWLKIKGKIYKGRKRGICTITLIDGSKIRCKFKKNKANGNGTFTEKNGNEIYGKWKDNIFESF